MAAAHAKKSALATLALVLDQLPAETVQRWTQDALDALHPRHPQRQALAIARERLVVGIAEERRNPPTVSGEAIDECGHQDLGGLRPAVQVDSAQQGGVRAAHTAESAESGPA